MSADFAAAFSGFWAEVLPSLRLPVTAGTAGDVGGFSPLQQPWWQSSAGHCGFADCATGLHLEHFLLQSLCSIEEDTARAHGISQ